MVHHPALDLGYFLAQLRYQLRAHDLHLDEQELLTIYQSERQAPVPDLEAQLPWFELRALISIAAYLIKLGKGTTPDMLALIDRARTLATKLNIPTS
jgi:hypothetical protein